MCYLKHRLGINVIWETLTVASLAQKIGDTWQICVEGNFTMLLTILHHFFNTIHVLQNEPSTKRERVLVVWLEKYCSYGFFQIVLMNNMTYGQFPIGRIYEYWLDKSCKHEIVETWLLYLFQFLDRILSVAEEAASFQWHIS